MTDYTKLVEALRERAQRENEWYEHDGDIIKAAAAIEALQAEIRESMQKCAECVENEPKRGEWVGVSPTVDTVQCSVCGGQLFSAELETPYCPYCGAKMTEVQE